MQKATSSSAAPQPKALSTTTEHSASAGLVVVARRRELARRERAEAVVESPRSHGTARPHADWLPAAAPARIARAGSPR
eukprot:1044140-Alexandrium_andersonii.AAC.1